MQNNMLDNKINLFSKLSKISGKISPARGNLSAAASKQSKDTDVENELYDVDRWREAEQQAQWNRDVTGTSGSNIEQVRRKWNKSDASDSIQGILSSEQDAASSRREKAGSELRINSVYARINKDQQISDTEIQNDLSGYIRKNHLGLSVVSGIDKFFSSNPINSCLLAGDSLSMGYLSMNQTGAHSYFGGNYADRENDRLEPAEIVKASDASYMQKRRDEAMKKRDDIKIL